MKNIYNTKSEQIFIAVAFVFALFLLLSNIVFVTYVGAVQQKGLTLSPLRTEVEIAPGTSVENKLSVTNSTDKLMVVNLSAEVFSVINQQYDYAFTEESDVIKWVSFKPSSLELKAGESANVLFSINVPLQSEPGGRYISMFASNNTTVSGQGLSSRQRIASLLYINVTGDVSREGQLISLSSPWLITGDSLWSVALRNTGTTHFRSRHNVQVMNLYGKKDSVVGTTAEALILPGSVRSISGKLPAPQWPGVYKIIYNIGLGDTPARLETRYVIYLSPLSILVLAVIGTVTVYWVRIKRSNKTD